MSSKLFLYDHPVSGYAQKVRMVLRFKNLPFDKEVPAALGSGQPDAPFQDANIRMEVPALVDGTFKIFDSTAILMYLEDKFTDAAHPTLFPAPSTPESRAEARMIEEVMDTHYEAINWALGEIFAFKRADGAEAARLAAAAKEQTFQIQEWLATRLGDKPFFSGASIGYADFAVAPYLNRSVAAGNGPAEGSPLHAWHKRVGEVPCVAETWKEVADALPKMASAGAAMFAKGSGRRREYRDHRLEWMIKNGALGIVQKGLEDDTIRFSWPQPKSAL
jgi:glutathione S-transferase